jgi:hypothetical protein
MELFYILLFAEMSVYTFRGQEGQICQEGQITLKQQGRSQNDG